MLTFNDAANLLVFLERVQLHAREVDTFVDVREKLRAIARPPVQPAAEPDSE